MSVITNAFVVFGGALLFEKRVTQSCTTRMSVQLHTRAPTEAQSVVDFVRRETGWFVADGEIEFCMDMGECTYATVNGDLASMAVCVPTGDGASTLAYVVTGKVHRRMGLARRVVCDVLQRAGKDVRLIASKDGESLYHQLNFVPVPNWLVGFLVRQPSTMPLTTSKERFLEPASDSLEAAARVKFGYSAETEVPFRGRICFVLQVEGVIYSAAWVYPIYKIDRSTPGAWLGPVYGTSDVSAGDVAAGAITWWITQYGPCAFNALVPRTKLDNNFVQFLVNFGFDNPTIKSPTMRRVDSNSTVMHDPSKTLYTLSGWTRP